MARVTSRLILAAKGLKSGFGALKAYTHVDAKNNLK